MFWIFRRKKAKEKIETAEEETFWINFDSDPRMPKRDTPLYGDAYDCYEDYSKILIDLQEYTQTYECLMESIDALLRQHYVMRELQEVINDHVGDFKIRGRKHLCELIQGCFDAYAKNREDAMRIFRSVYELKDVVNLEELEEEYKKQMEDLVSDNEKVIMSLKRFLEAFGQYLSGGDERFTPEHFMDMGAVRRLDQFSTLLEGITVANEATVQELLIRLAEATKPAEKSSDGDWEERLQNVPTIMLDPEVSSAPTADGF